MGRSTREETERKLRKMAIATVDMMHGTYQWPPNGRPFDASGAPRISKLELMRHVGYQRYRNGGKALFEDPYYKKQVALELARREQAFRFAANKKGASILDIGLLLFNELRTRVLSDPGGFSTRELFQYAPQILKMGLEIEERRAGTERPDFKGLLAEQVQTMDADTRERVAGELEERRGERDDRMRLLVEAANAIEEEADDDLVAEPG